MSKGKYLRSEEHKEKMSLSMKGKTFSEKTLFKKGNKPWNTGKNLSEQIRRKISSKLKGKDRLDLRGKLHPNWKGGLQQILRPRNTLEYKLWRTAVFQRDRYTCIWCGQKGGILNADHVKSWASYPELRFAIDNGRTLCLSCHKTTNTFAGKSKRKL